MMDNDTSRLLTLIRELAYERKEVTLSSGARSDFYVDCRRVSLHPEGLVLCGRLLYRAYQALGEKIDGVGGPTLGADPLVASFVATAYTEGEAIPAFIVRKASKSHGMGQMIEGRSNLPAEARVLVLEDVVTTGASSVRAIEVCRKGGLHPIHLLALVDRCEGGRAAVEGAGVPMGALFEPSDIAGDHDGA